MNEQLVKDLMIKARKSFAAGDKLQAQVWHNLAKQARDCAHKI
jgi:hypothetical protein